MATASHTRRTTTHKPSLALFAAVGSAWVFVLVTLGAFTTSIGAGMAFPDWPLSNGSINPDGWLTDAAKFAEHSHRLSGMMMGFITIGLAAWLWRVEERAWLRRLGLWALGIVILQGVIGGQRVTLNAIDIPWFHMSLGEVLRIPHGILAQIYVCVLIAIAIGCSRSWIERSTPVGSAVRTMGLVCTALMFVQLVIAVTMRHNAAGLAIYTFPYSTPAPENHWLPNEWNFRVAIHFAHRVMALILAFALTAFAWTIRRDRASTAGMKAGASALISLLVLQILLGAQIIWTMRRAEMTTGHVVVGAVTLAVTFWLTCRAHRDAIEGSTPLATPSRP
ncbi:COX15/CtaA family protein [Horticoccus sp. 23ND18S-11]|uniref:COX15/CtaA family protein n=1 Tax=Horticoccus sp. 23ND18S-11 TaxID=3391832 RepID=UPI0039C9060A